MKNIILQSLVAVAIIASLSTQIVNGLSAESAKHHASMFGDVHAFPSAVLSNKHSHNHQKLKKGSDSSSSVPGVAAPAGGVYHYGQQVMTIERPEGPRYFIVYIPDSYKPSTPATLLFLFHGLNDNCENFIDATDFKPLVGNESMILVAPCGSIGLLGIAWNSGTCCGFLDEQHPNDFVLTKTIVANLTASLAIDANNIYSIGFSNGAFMSEVLACVFADTFRGVASVSGVVELRPGNAGGLAQCNANISAAKYRPNVLMIHGDADFLVPWTGDPLLGFPPIPTNADDWVSRNGCSNQFIQTINKTYYTNQIWDTGCKSGRGVEGRIELVRHHDGAHMWPEDDEFVTTSYIFEWVMAQKNAL